MVPAVAGRRPQQQQRPRQVVQTIVDASHLHQRVGDICDDLRVGGPRPPGGPGQAFAQYQCLVQATKPDQGIHSAEPDHAGSPLVAEQAHHHFGVLTIDHGLQVVPADGEVTDGLQRTVRVRG